MGVIFYSFNLNISPKMSHGVLQCDIVMLQNYMLMSYDFVIKRGAIFARPCIFIYLFFS